MLLLQRSGCRSLPWAGPGVERGAGAPGGLGPCSGTETWCWRVARGAPGGAGSRGHFSLSSLKGHSKVILGCVGRCMVGGSPHAPRITAHFETLARAFPAGSRHLLLGPTAAPGGGVPRAQPSRKSCQVLLGPSCVTRSRGQRGKPYRSPRGRCWGNKACASSADARGTAAANPAAGLCGPGVRCASRICLGAMRQFQMDSRAPQFWWLFRSPSEPLPVTPCATPCVTLGKELSLWTAGPRSRGFCLQALLGLF